MSKFKVPFQLNSSCQPLKTTFLVVLINHISNANFDRDD